MKTIKLITGLFMVMLIMNSCANDPDPEIWEYQPIMFTFQDASGKDLIKETVEPLLVKFDGDEFLSLSEEYYSLKILYPEPCMDPDKALVDRIRKAGGYPDYYPSPRFYYDDTRLKKNQDIIWGMCFVPETSNKCAKTDIMTLIVKSPIFGDDKEQEFVIYFDGLKVSRILFNEKECYFSLITLENFTTSNIISYTPRSVVAALTSITL